MFESFCATLTEEKNLIYFTKNLSSTNSAEYLSSPRRWLTSLLSAQLFYILAYYMRKKWVLGGNDTKNSSKSRQHWWDDTPDTFP